MWKHISQGLQDKHVGRIHPNLVRPLYLNIPITEPAWEDQHGVRHVNTFDIEALDHDDPWAVYIKDYNRIRNKAFETKVVDVKADEAAQEEHNYDPDAPKPMKPLIGSFEDAEDNLDLTLSEARRNRTLATALPGRGTDQYISDCLQKCIIEYATKTKELYKDLFFHIAACEMTIFCAIHQGPVWSSENLMSQDPQQTRVEPDYSTFISRGKHPAFNHNLELQHIAYKLTHTSREHLRYQLLITSLAIYISAITTTHDDILKHVCKSFQKILDSNYPKQRNNETINPPENVTMINLRLALAAMNYYAAAKARNSIQEAVQKSYYNVVCQARSKNGLPFPILTELLGFNLSMSSEQKIKLNELINRKNNLLDKIQTYNANVHGRSENEMEPLTPLAPSTTTIMSAEDAALAALTTSACKRKYSRPDQQVTLSTLTNNVVIQYPFTNVHAITGKTQQDTEAPSSGIKEPEHVLDQQRNSTPIPPRKRVRSHRNRRVKRRRQRRYPPRRDRTYRTTQNEPGGTS
jgi:hypothetical protein